MTAAACACCGVHPVAGVTAATAPGTHGWCSWCRAAYVKRTKRAVVTQARIAAALNIPAPQRPVCARCKVNRQAPPSSSPRFPTPPDRLAWCSPCRRAERDMLVCWSKGRAAGAVRLVRALGGIDAARELTDAVRAAGGVAVAVRVLQDHVHRAQRFAVGE